MPEEKDPLFNDENKQEVTYNNLKFGKVGDYFRGVLADNSKQILNKLSKTREMQTVYEFKAQGGKFHNIKDRIVDKEVTTIVAGDFWSYITGKPALVGQLKKAAIGQIVGFKFSRTDEPKTPGFDKTKIIDVYIGEMDPEYQGETAGDQA